MAISSIETCQEYHDRRIREGWKVIERDGFNVVLQSPDGIIRPLDLRNDIETLRPNGVGNETGITNQTPGSGDHYDKVDEVSPDSVTTSVSTSNISYERDLYDLSNSGVGAGTINSVTVFIFCKNGYYKPSLRTGGSTFDGAEKTKDPEDYNWYLYSEVWEQNPDTIAAWVWAEIDALEAGVALKKGVGTNCYCTQVYVEVDYSEAIAFIPTVTII